MLWRLVGTKDAEIVSWYVEDTPEGPDLRYFTVGSCVVFCPGFVALFAPQENGLPVRIDPSFSLQHAIDSATQDFDDGIAAVRVWHRVLRYGGALSFAFFWRWNHPLYSLRELIAYFLVIWHLRADPGGDRCVCFRTR